MGATLIETTSRGASMREAYNLAVEDAVYETGNDPYNGTISTTNGVIDITKEFRASGKSLGEYADYLYENNKLQKWGPAAGICVAEPVVNTPLSILFNIPLEVAGLYDPLTTLATNKL